MYRGWTKIDYQDKHCITYQTDKGTEDDRGRDGRTNFTWRIKEQATRLNPLFEHDDDDDIQQDATLHSLFYLKTALYVSGGTTTHH